MADSNEAAQQITLDCYLNTITDIAHLMEEISPESATVHGEELTRLRNNLALEPTEQALGESRKALQTELANFAARTRGKSELRTQDLKHLLILLARTSDSFTVRQDGYVEEFRQLSRHLQQAEELHDPAAMREALEIQFEKVLAFMEGVYQENNRSFAKLRDELDHFRRRLDLAEANSPLDPLTGLASRGELERQVDGRMRQPRDFSLLRFEIANLQAIQAEQGEHCSDQVIKQVGSALACQVRARDFVCRWDGGEFLVILECAAATARVRARSIAHWLTGNYRWTQIGEPERSVDVELAATVMEKRTPATAGASLHKVAGHTS